MFEKFLYRKNLIKIIISEYENSIGIYRNVLSELLEFCDETTSKDTILKQNHFATQQYYTNVFNNIINILSYGMQK